MFSRDKSFFFPNNFPSVENAWIRIHWCRSRGYRGPTAYNYKIIFLWFNTVVNTYTSVISVIYLLFCGPCFLTNKETSWEVQGNITEPKWKRHGKTGLCLICRLGNTQSVSCSLDYESRGFVHFPFGLHKLMLDFYHPQIKNPHEHRIFFYWVFM